MARPPKELAERELEVLQSFWRLKEAGVAKVRDELSSQGLNRAYTTVATLVRILFEKRYLEQINEQRPFRYRPSPSFDDASEQLLKQVIDRVFRESGELLWIRLIEQKISDRERTLLA